MESQESGGPESQNETWAVEERELVVEVRIPVGLEVRESYSREGRGRWVARHQGLPRVELRASTRAGALAALAEHLRIAFGRLLSVHAK